MTTAPWVKIWSIRVQSAHAIHAMFDAVVHRVEPPSSGTWCVARCAQYWRQRDETASRHGRRVGSSPTRSRRRSQKNGISATTIAAAARR